MMFTDYENIREALAREVRGAVRDDIRDYLVENGFVEEVLLGAGGLETLRREYLRLNEIGRAERRGDGIASKQETLGPDDRLLLVSSIVAKEVAQRPDVKSLGTEVLGGKAPRPA